MLNEDIVSLIIDSYANWWQWDLVRLARVSSSWLWPIRRCLYACPALSSYHSCILLVQTLNSNPSLARLIHGLVLQPIDYGCDLEHESGGGSNRYNFFASVHVLLALPGLTSLSLEGDLSNSADRFLRCVASPHTISLLRIACPIGCDTELATLEWDAQLSLRFCNLKKLELIAVELDVSGGPCEEPGASHGCRLEELKLNRVSVLSGSLPELLTLRASWGRLRVLTIINDDPHLEEHLCALLALPLNALEIISYECCAYCRRESSAPFGMDNYIGRSLLSFSPFTAVHTFTLKSDYPPASLLDLLDYSFPNVVSVELTMGTQSVVEAWVMSLSRGVLKKLSKLELRQTSTEVEHLNVLKEICTNHNIELTT